jgi:hypothetical protein
MSVETPLQTAWHTRRNEAFYDQRFEGVTLRIDGNLYDGCSFYNCTLEFAANAPPVFRRCHLVNTTFTFVGAASVMMYFLASLANDFDELGKEAFLNLFKLLERGDLDPDAPDSRRVVAGAANLSASATMSAAGSVVPGRPNGRATAEQR